MSDTASTIVSTNVTVNPRIDAELDVDKMSRLLSLLHMLLSIVPKSTTSPPSTSDVREPDCQLIEKDANELSKESYAAVEKSRREFNLRVNRINRNRTSHTKRNAADLDDATTLLELHATLPCVNLDLVYDNSTLTSSSVQISLQKVVFTLVNKAFDMSVQFELGVVRVLDSLRAPSQSCIVTSQVNSDLTSHADDSSSSKLINVSFQLIKNIRSPIYDSVACGCAVEAEFGQLFLTFDSNFFLHFRPFYEVLLSLKADKLMDKKLTSKFEDKTIAKKVDSMQDSDSPVGMSLTVQFRELSLSLLQNNNYNYMRQVPLNQIFTFSFQDLGTDVQIGANDQVKAYVSIRSISLHDTRDISENLYFKTILRPIAAGSDRDESCPKSLENYVDIIQPTGIHDLRGTTDQLSLLFEQYSLGCQDISLIMRSLCIYVSMDVIMEVVNTTLENVNGVLQLLQPLDDSSSQEIAPVRSDKDDIVVNEHQESSPSPEDYPIVKMWVSIKVPNPQLIFLEDPATEHSKAIVFRSNFSALLTKANNDVSRKEDVVQALNLSLFDVELFMLGDMSMWQPHQILSPVRVEAGLSQTFSFGKLMTITSCVNIDEVNLNLSLNDILLIQSILLRRSLSVPASTTIESPDSSQSNIHRNGDNQKIQEPQGLVLVKVVFNMRTTIVKLVNDFHGYNNAILRLSMEETAFKVDGFVQDMTGSGFVTVKIDYFNPLIVEWEPLLETWQPELEVSSNTQEVKITSTTHQTLQLNITSTLLEMISSTYAMLVTYNSMIPSTARKTPPTITFINQLGISVSLFDSETQDRLFILNPARFGTNIKDEAIDNLNAQCNENAKGYLFVGSKGKHSAVRMQRSSDAQWTSVANYPEKIDVHIDESTFAAAQSMFPRLSTTQLNASITCPFEELSLDCLQAALVNSAVDNSAVGASKKVKKVDEESFEYQRYNPMIFSKGWYGNICMTYVIFLECNYV